MADIPEQLRQGPFTRATALAAGVTPRVLEGPSFVRVFPRVYAPRLLELTEEQWRSAAAMALPDRARLTGITRLQALGLDFGPRRPLRFVLEGDLHLDLDGVFVHRTRKLAPHDDSGVSPAAAFLAYCALARVIDAIKVGDWLLHHDHTDRAAVLALADAAPWRAGALEATWVLDHLDAAARSLMESECRAVLAFAGLPEPEVNAPLPLGPGREAFGDLWFEKWRTVVEYEGSHHQDDRDQYLSDLDRYALLRRADLRYVQVTKELLARPRRFVGAVHRELVAAGYDGPPPAFGDRWRTLFGSVTAALGPRPAWRAVS